MGHKKKTSKAQFCEKPAVLACLEPLLQNCLDSLSNKEQNVILKMENKISDGLNWNSSSVHSKKYKCEKIADRQRNGNILHYPIKQSFQLPGNLDESE